ncbi:MAG: bifunctional glutamate N-acetyltransferase/amino-acid acetyltransferase ArgJ, partial [Deltaproteobacteria bacterium]|nr:bifunctional glutamate N-acetyltransferase/amino-acid acetyltransferase ArgJ [Deltaproteobacteria bacterium]
MKDMYPKGFRAGAVASGMRYQDRPDLGLIVADSFHSGAAVFTRNLCKAAPVLWSQKRFEKGRAVLANAGQANAQTGPKGLADAKESARRVAGLLGVKTDEVLLASTGIIGQPMEMGKLTDALPGLVGSLGGDGFDLFSQAILTTDTGPKTGFARGDVEGREFTIWACAKGSGMISPSMATMLAFVLCDLKVEPDALQRILRRACDRTLNRVTVDGDGSTNDSLFLLCSGLSPLESIKSSRSQLGAVFEESLTMVLYSLAQQIAIDGEGSTKYVVVTVRGARNDREAALAARTVAESPLVKTAFYGEDPNWGRVLAALGRSGASFDPYKVDLDLLFAPEDEPPDNEPSIVPWVRNGMDNGCE